ncbi:MAG TPA: hypothetical protein VM364_09605 [Vicinamibacterales bacterium]|nr:hypothetical protein [Vicinamibacterales bacterium]
MRTVLTAALAAMALAASLAAAPAVRGDSEAKSPLLVKQLMSLLAARQMEAIATVDPADHGRIVAALAFPGIQLLVISSHHKNADYLQMQITKRQFREVYDALQHGTVQGRLFFHDLGCDGFAHDGEYIDLFYEGASQRTMFDGNWMAQSLTQAEYEALRKKAEEKYAAALTLLIDATKKVPVPTVD